MIVGRLILLTMLMLGALHVLEEPDCTVIDELMGAI